MIKFLVDENIGSSSVSFLRKNGFDVVWTVQKYPGTQDSKLLEIAESENRILLTADKDFAYLVFVAKLPHKGVILLRLKSKSPLAQVDAVSKILSSAYINKVFNNFTVVTDSRVKIRSPRL